MFPLALEQSAVLSQFILNSSLPEAGYTLPQASTGAGHSVLIVGSSVSLVRLLATGLAAESLHVDVAHSRREALERFERRQYLLVILDLDPPNGAPSQPADGPDLLKELRLLQPQVRVLALGGQSGVAGLVSALEQGADDFVFKPFSLIELMTRVRALRRSNSTNGDGKRQSAKLILHRDRCQVEREGRMIDLTPREFGLLEVLVENAGKTLSRAMLTERVWNMSAEANTNIVDVYIKYLRDKIDGDHEEKLIRTVRGMGYLFQN